jgi:hypothetical protein
MARVTSGSMWMVAVMMVAVMMAGCGPRAAPAAPEPPPGEEVEPVEAAMPRETAMAARQAVAEATGVEVGEVEIVAADRVQWPDACLGLAEPDEMCAQVITPGWRVELHAADRRHVVHTDDGETVRLAP